MITDGIVTGNVCVIPKRPVVIRLLDRNGISVLFSDPVSFVAAVVVVVVVFIAAFIVVFVVAIATVVIMAVVVVGVTVEV